MKTFKRTTTHFVSDINTEKQLREGTSIEEVLRLATANKEQKAQMLPELYQARNEGIDPMCDIRTDKFEMAQAAMDKVTRAHLLARQNKEKFGSGDNTWVTDEDGNPLFETSTQLEE